MGEFPRKIYVPGQHRQQSGRNRKTMDTVQHQWELSFSLALGFWIARLGVLRTVLCDFLHCGSRNLPLDLLPSCSSNTLRDWNGFHLPSDARDHRIHRILSGQLCGSHHVQKQPYDNTGLGKIPYPFQTTRHSIYPLRTAGVRTGIPVFHRGCYVRALHLSRWFFPADHSLHRDRYHAANLVHLKSLQPRIPGAVRSGL